MASDGNVHRAVAARTRAASSGCSLESGTPWKTAPSIRSNVIVSEAPSLAVMRPSSVLPSELLQVRTPVGIRNAPASSAAPVAAVTAGEGTGGTDAVTGAAAGRGPGLVFTRRPPFSAGFGDSVDFREPVVPRSFGEEGRYSGTEEVMPEK